MMIPNIWENKHHVPVIDTTHENGDEWGMVYDIAIPTLSQLHIHQMPDSTSPFLKIDLAASAWSFPFAILESFSLYFENFFMWQHISSGS